jgi:hypothetical protein
MGPVQRRLQSLDQVRLGCGVDGLCLCGGFLTCRYDGRCLQGLSWRSCRILLVRSRGQHLQSMAQRVTHHLQAVQVAYRCQHVGGIALCATRFEQLAARQHLPADFPPLALYPNPSWPRNATGCKPGGHQGSHSSGQPDHDCPDRSAALPHTLGMSVLRLVPKRLTKRAQKAVQRVVVLYNRLQHGHWIDRYPILARGHVLIYSAPRAHDFSHLDIA